MYSMSLITFLRAPDNSNSLEGFSYRESTGLVIKQDILSSLLEEVL